MEKVKLKLKEKLENIQQQADNMQDAFKKEYASLIGKFQND